MNTPSSITSDEIAKTLEECRKRLEARPKRITDVMLMDYREQYLRSLRWRRIKKRILERDNRICQSCGGIGNVVHHRSYAREVLEGNDDSMLATVCSGCHNLIHFADDGTKQSDVETDTLLLAGQRQADIPAIKIDLRTPIASPPENWDRMTAVQRELWYETHNKLRREKWLKRNKDRPSREPGGFFGPEFWAREKQKQGKN